jgi:lipid A 3-O-deacylase
MRHRIGWAAAVWAVCAAAEPAAAGPRTLTVNVGSGQVLDSGGGAEGGVELAFSDFWLGIAPTLGGLVSDTGSSYAYFGFRRDFAVGTRLSLTPFTGAGAYRQGDGVNLGGSTQFRSGLEIGLRLRQRDRLSLSLYHLSNAGLQRPNPGTESVVLGYSFTVGGGSAAGEP